MNLRLLLSVVSLVLSAGAVVAEAPAPRRGESESVAVFLQLDAPAHVAPDRVPEPRLPLWQSGFRNSEQLRNEMLSHHGWGGG